MILGSNYYTKISDIMTDGFDLLYQEWEKDNKHAKPATKRLVAKIVSNARANTDDAFRTQYKQTRTLIKSLK